MVTVPGFLLRRLYVKGSLRNSDRGFQFQLKNQLGSGYARRMLPLSLDSQEIPIESSRFTLEAEEVSFSDVSESVPFTLKMNKISTIMVDGIRLDKSPHKIGMAFEVKGLGVLSFDFMDTVTDG